MAERPGPSAATLFVASLSKSAKLGAALDPFRRAGFAIEPIEWQEVKALAPGTNHLVLLQVGSAWNEAFSRLETLADEQRSSIVLTGRRQGQQLLQRTMEMGLLAASAEPVPGWFPGLLLDALPRLLKTHRRQLRRVLGQLRRVTESEPPEGVLERAASLAGELLAADLAVASLKTAEAPKFSALVRKEDGAVGREDWNADPKRLQAPSGLAPLVLRRGETLLWPNLAHLRPLEGGGLAPGTAALIKPLRAPEDDFRAGQNPLVACLNLYWSDPHLPTPHELAAFEAIASVAREAVWRLFEKARTATIQEISRRILSLHVETEPDPTEVDIGGEEAAATEKVAGPAQRLAALVYTYSTWKGLRRLVLQYPEVWKTPWTWATLTAPEPGGEAFSDELAGKLSEEGATTNLGAAGWGFRTLIADRRPALGSLIATFETERAARAAREDLELLSKDVLFLLRAERLAADARALQQLPSAPKGESEANTDLRAALDLIQKRTNSDGAKVLMVLSHDGQPTNWQLWNLEVSAQAPEQPAPKAIDPERGFTNWVVFHNDWLLIPDRDPSQPAGKDPEHCLTGTNGEQWVRAVSEKEDYPNFEQADQERTMLFVPMSSRGTLVGVLAIWRNRPEPYTSRDPARLLNFVPPVEAACLRLMQLKKAEEERDAIARLAQVLNTARSTRQVYSEIAHASRSLSNAAAALLLLRDETSGLLHLAAVSGVRSRSTRALKKKLGRFLVTERREDEHALLELEDRLPDFKLRRVVDTTAPGLEAGATSGVSDDTSTAACLVLLDRRSTVEVGPFAVDQLLVPFADSYFHAACASLRSFPLTLAGRLLDELGNPGDGEPKTAEHVLEQTGRLLLEASSADACLLYTGTPRQTKLRRALPSFDHAKLPTTPSKFTESVLSSEKARVILEASLDQGNLDQDASKFLATALGWTSLGSWLACPVVLQGHRIGLIKLLTSDHGPFLGQEHVAIAKQLAQRAGAEMQRARAEQEGRELLEMTRVLTQFHGKQLGRELAARLETWVRAALHRPACRIAVVAFTLYDRSKLLAAMVQGPSEERDTETIGTLQELSRAALARKAGGKQQAASTRSEPIPVQDPKGQGVQISLPGQDRLGGHLFALDDEPFYPDDVETLQRAAQYVAFTLDTERERSVARQAMGRFRHALLGPAQGLTEAAEFVVHLAGGPTTSPELKRAQGIISKESEILRLWRENQRFYLSEEMKVRITRFPLRPLVDRCILRWTRYARSRDISIRPDFQPKGELQIDADEEAIDLALSNLLENACKYSFHGQTVTVGVRLEGQVVKLWVEDEGHPVPKAIDKVIYEPGVRGVERDPFRLIIGQGLGLAMAGIAASLHAGRLFHHSELLVKGRSPDTDRYKVRFTLELPWTLGR